MLERVGDPLEVDAEPWARPRGWAEKSGHSGVLTELREHGVWSHRITRHSCRRVF